MFYVRSVSLLVLVLIISACAPTKYNPNELPSDIRLSPKVKLPLDYKLAIYLPEAYRKSSIRLKGTRQTVEVGKSIEAAISLPGNTFFKEAVKFDKNLEDTYSLLLDVDPDYDIKSGDITYKLSYKVIDGMNNTILKGFQSHTAGYTRQHLFRSFENAAIRASQKMYSDIANRLSWKQDLITHHAKMNEANLELLIDRNKDTLNITGVKINNKGNILTWRNAIANCLIAEVDTEKGPVNVNYVSKSYIFDLSLLSADFNFSSYAKFPKGDIALLPGESISSISFPWDPEVKSSPVMSMGHINSESGLEASRGFFQYSSAVKPVSSGGAIMNSKGEIIGIKTGWLGGDWLAKSNKIPENVYFALKGDYIKKFLDFNLVDYSLNNSNAVKNSVVAAKESTVKIACYQ